MLGWRWLSCGLLVSACTVGGGGTSKIGPERLVAVHPRLLLSYLLTTVNTTVVDYEQVRDDLCKPTSTVVQCQRAERVHTQLRQIQTTLVRMLGNAPESDAPVLEFHPPLPKP